MICLSIFWKVSVYVVLRWRCKRQFLFMVRKFLILTTLLACSLIAEARQYHFTVIDSVFDSLARRMDCMDFNNERDKIKPEDINMLNKRAEQTGNRQLKARALYWSVRVTQIGAHPQKCITVLKKAEALCSQIYDYDRAVIDYQLAGNYERIGNYGKAYNLLTSVIPVFERHEDYFFAGNAALLLAQLFIDIDDSGNAKSNLMKAKNYYRKAGFPLNRIYYFEAVISDAGDKMKLYKLALADRCGKDWCLSVQTLAEISRILVLQNKADSAETYIREAYRTLEENDGGNKPFLALIQISQVRVLYSQKRYSEALAVLGETMRNKDALQGEYFLEEIYKYLWKVYGKLGNYVEAYKYMELYYDYHMRNDNNIKRQDVPKARAREMIALHKKEIQILEKNAELSRVYMYTALLGTTVIILMAVIFCMFLIQRNRKRKLENRELQSSLQREVRIHNTDKLNFEQDIKRKECEISSSTLLLDSKNGVLQQIGDIVRHYYDEGMMSRECEARINAVIEKSVKNDDNWQRFKLHFDMVHPEFFVKLKKVGSGLTENDIRLCAYLRIGMRAKQVAEMLSVTPDSINTSRYRIRKKLGLRRGESLDDFIRSI